MASSDFLRKNLNQHLASKNILSKKMDKDIDVAIVKVLEVLTETYPNISFNFRKTFPLKEIIEILKIKYPKYSKEFAEVFDSSFIKPDGGFIYFLDKDEKIRIVLVSEVKRQGTNDKRLEEGLKKQARGNAIERLGKNLSGIKALFKDEEIIPFVCFGSGDDFKDDSSILDRVKTMNDYFPLNKMFVKKDHLPLEPVSMFFRYKDWTVEEMVEIMLKAASESMEYYKNN